MREWAALEVAGAFVLGIVLGGLAVARVTRAVMDYLNGERAKRQP